MSSYDPRMDNLPVFISYPRSGSHWVNGVLELYFNRPRLRNGGSSFIKNRSDFMWFHDHDIDSSLKLKHNNILYLYRNPINVSFSLLMAEKPNFNINDVKNQINLIKNHWDKYLFNNYSKTIINYEKLYSKNYYNEFEKAISFFGKNLNKNKLDNILPLVTKNKIEKKQKDKRYFNKYMLSKDYENKRILFFTKYYELFSLTFNNKRYKDLCSLKV